MLDKRELQEISKNPYKADFPLFTTHPDIVFLDSAATSQRPALALSALQEFYTNYNANPLRGLYSLSVEATEKIADARAHIANFIGAKNPNEVVFTRNTSESLNLVANSLGRLALNEGDEVVISIMEHHSNLIPWQQICKERKATLKYLRLNENFEITDEELEAKIGPKTKIVSLTQVSNVLGVKTNIKKAAGLAHKVGAYMVVDGAQSVPHMPVDVAELDIDLLAFSAHKMGGPMGIGVLWGKMDILNQMDPFLTGGEMIDSVTETSAVWAPVPHKFEAGTQDTAGIYAFDAALGYIQDKGMDKLEAREQLLSRYLCDELSKLDYIDITGPVDGSRHIGSVSFTMKGVHPHDVASILDGHGICIRAGDHCAEPLLIELDVPMGSTCRASVAFYNDKSDIDKLIAGLGAVWSVFNG